MKTIKGLEAYIRTLPSVEDFREVKAKLEAKSSHNKDTESRLEDAEKTVRSLRAELQSVNKEKLRLEIDNKELEARNKEMGSQVRPNRFYQVQVYSLYCFRSRARRGEGSRPGSLMITRSSGFFLTRRTSRTRTRS